MIKLTIDGDAVAQGRARAGKTRSGRTVLYDPSKSRDYKQYVQLVASQQKPEKPLEGQLHMVIDIYRAIPKSMPKYKQEQARALTLRPVTKPDVTNVAKGIEDALNGIMYKDDSQIVTLQINKYYSDNPRVEIEIEEEIL